MPGEVVAVVAVFWLFSLIVARLDGERIGYWKGEAAAAKRQREAIEHVLATGAERATEGDTDD